MNNCPKGPQDWTLVNRKNTPLPSLAPSLPTPATVPSPPSHHSSVAPPPTITIQKAPNQPSMEIDPSPLHKDTTIDFLETELEEPENCILALPAVFKDRPIIISTN
ncbi:unnamed protein product, partial [Brassica rapa]